ncbi:MAG TPA: pyridoxamine 5'-phosphate oxidase family protein [Sedimentisphaerales bacterium]|jgi:hypothetical protein|nr:pyridoxamine 5'-phosphate oxidase family protein [Sedimentisphaerales bacterium]HNU28158.1 pyridoxamine 5'-phosphate oxidase family protein [Sedimentisphaerales bacterium]
MNLTDYFEKTTGLGILATADAQGRVDVALYARPHVMEDGEIAFIMGDRLSHDNVAANPHAAYLFLERGAADPAEPEAGYNGLRLYLTRTREETDPQKIDAVRRTGRRGRGPEDAPKFLVHFRVDRVRRLVAD